MYGYHFHEGCNVFIDSLSPPSPVGAHVTPTFGHFLAQNGRDDSGKSSGQRVRSQGVKPSSDANLLCDSRGISASVHVGTFTSAWYLED